MATIYSARVEARSDLLRSDADREAIELLRSIIEEIRVVPHEDTDYRLEGGAWRHPCAIAGGQEFGGFGCAEGAKNQVGCGGAFCVWREEKRRIRAFRPVIRSM